MHAKLPRRFVAPFVDALKAFAQMIISWATVFSGTDIAAEALSACRYAYVMLFSVQVKMTQTLMCESDPEKISSS